MCRPPAATPLSLSPNAQWGLSATTVISQGQGLDSDTLEVSRLVIIGI